MNRFYRIVRIATWWVMGGLLLSPIGIEAKAEEEVKPVLESVTFLGGAGDQGNPYEWWMGSAVYGNKLYLCGSDRTVLNGQSLVACYPLPLAQSPLWVARWPGQKGGGWNEETFLGMIATAQGVYCAGRSIGATSDGVGDHDQKSVLVAFPLNGPTGPAVGGALWMTQPPFFFPYAGIESFLNVIAVEEGGATFFYATGRSQYDGSNNTAVLAKLDVQGRVLWQKVLGDSTPWFKWSQGDSLVAMNGSIYVAGYAHYPTNIPSVRPHVGLWRVDPTGKVLWFKTSLKSILQDSGAPVSISSSGGFLYVAATQEKGPYGAADLLIMKFDENGSLVAEFTWGGADDDSPAQIVARGDRLYVVGFTKSKGAGGKDAFLLCMDATTGKVLSELIYGGELDDMACALQVVGKEIYVIGSSRSFATEQGNLSGQSDVMILRYLLQPFHPIMSVPIDIKPGEKAPNPIHLKAKGKIPVAILSSREFDAPAIVDRDTLTFGRTGLEKSMTSQPCGVEDVNKDGILDLVCHFENEQAGFQTGDVSGILRGKTLSGKLFQGIDLIKVVPPAKEKAEERKMQPSPTPPRVRQPSVPTLPPVVRQPAMERKPAPGSNSTLRPKRAEVHSLKEGEVAY